MNEFDILKELEKLDDDIEPGFLSELKQQTPDELHSRIMDSIRMEAMKSNNTIGIATMEDTEKTARPIELKQRFRFNYRRYATVASAAVILAVVFIGGAKEILQRDLTPDTLTPKQSIVIKEKTPDNTSTFNMQLSETSKTDPLVAATPKANKGEQSTAGVQENYGTNFEDNKKVQTENVNPQIAKVPTAASIKKETPVPGLNTGSNDNSMQRGFTVVPSKKADSSKNIAAEVPQTTASNNDTENAEPSVETRDNNNLSIAAKDNESTSNDAEAMEKAAGALKIASIENMINYEITIAESQSNVIQFLEDKGTMLAKGIYTLTTTNYEALNQMLASGKITPVKVNELEAGSQSIIIKLTIK